MDYLDSFITDIQIEEVAEYIPEAETDLRCRVRFDGRKDED